MSSAKIEDASLRQVRFSHIPETDAIWKGLRKHDITSTESAALFGLSPYMSKFELYHRKRLKDVTEIQMNDRMLWGQRMEAIIAEGIGADNGVVVRKVPEYVRIVRSRMGATFDFEIAGVNLGIMDRSRREYGSTTLLQQMFLDHGPGLFEIKATGYVEFRDNWTRNDDKTIEAPGHIEIQLQHQLHVKDSYEWGAIGVLVAGNSPKVTARMRDHEVGQGLEAACIQLWEDIKAGSEPDPTFPDDAPLIKSLNGQIADGKIYDGREDAELERLCNMYDDGLNAEGIGKAKKEQASAEIMKRIGDAGRALLKGFGISSWIQADANIEAHVRKGGRRLKITRKKAV